MSSLPVNPEESIPAVMPIQTEYANHLFRSRLEARWAVFFDTIGIPWEYEKEGYALPRSGWYLPDFWLPTLHLFIEIKGQAPNQAETGKAEELRDHVAPIAIFFGLPDPFNNHRGTLYCQDVCDSGGGNSEWEAWWGWREDGPYLAAEIYRSDRELTGNDYAPIGAGHWQYALDWTKDGHHDWVTLHSASKAAKCARFERGGR